MNKPNDEQPESTPGEGTRDSIMLGITLGLFVLSGLAMLAGKSLEAIALSILFLGAVWLLTDTP